MQLAHAMPFGAEITDEGVRFALWAPTASEVTLVTDEGEHAMPEAEGGWRRLVLPGARAGTRYRYRIGRDLLVPDPASRFQPEDVAGPSLVVDPRAYRWSDDGWTGRPWEEAVLYELHVGTATPEGTYAGLMGKLEELRDLGVTAIELLPLADFPGERNWGYDGVLHYAPDSAYGTPEDLKRLIDRAHALGLMMVLDVVYNHFGPAGNYLHAYAKTFFTERHQTPWGAGINFDGRAGPIVRDYFVHNAIYWLEEYRFDGLRFDAVHAIQDDSETHIIAELARRIRAAIPDREIHLVLENGANEARWLGRDESGRPPLHTAQWNDDIHHCWHRILTGEADGYYEDYDRPVARLGRCLAEGFAYQGEASRHEGKARGEPSGHLPPSAFVAFLQNHDQIGNRAFGDRIGELTSPEKLALARAGLILSPQIPLLYMGEEWQASSPFRFFVDFSEDPELSKAVRDGRRREFAHFKAFGEQHGDEPIPDPTAAETFERSRLDWHETRRDPHAEALAQTKALLRLRRDVVVPLTKSGFVEASYSLPSPDALEARWRFAAGSLRFLANFGQAEVAFEAEPGERPVWASPGVEPGTGIRLPAWTGIVLRSEA
jgi:maltooligosyltrehalose trehalohydrolase